MRILLVEDDPELSANLKAILTRLSFAVDGASHWHDAYERAVAEPYDCIVLDRGLPDGDGLELVTKLRQENISAPVLVLTAKAQTGDLVSGLNSGADDYLTKPFKLEELTARIRALTRRAKRIPVKPVLTVADLTVDTNTRAVSRNQRKISLSPKEYAVLEYLALHSCQAIDRMTLLEHAWGETIDLFSNTVDVHIRYLRQKIDRGHRHQLIRTVRGKGYMLCGR